MTDFHRLRTAVPAGAISLALLLAAPAMGAPAGSEYLPAEPSATGGQGEDAGSGSSAGSTGTAASDNTGADATAAQPKDGDRGQDKRAGEATDTISVAPAAVSDESSPSGAFDTLLDPIVLLLIAGVMAVAVGMTLRRRQGDEEGQDGDRALRDPATVPPTPDGEIVAGGERSS